LPGRRSRKEGGIYNRIKCSGEGEILGSGPDTRNVSRFVWQLEVDYYLFKYVDDPMTIKAQRSLIKELESTGIRVTPTYILREGTTGGEAITKEERYVQQLERAREQIEISQERRSLVDSLLQSHFTDEERQFIDLFWLTVKPLDRPLVGIRNKAVTREIGWLRNPDNKDRADRSYWDYRSRIYNKWWLLLYPDLEKDTRKMEYAEYMALLSR
jgi:hypothetical protein